MILLFNLLFRSMWSFRGMRRTAVQMPILSGSRGWLFSVSEAPDAVSRVHVDLACNGRAPSCSLDDQYVQYSTKRGLQRGQRTPQVFGLGKGV